MLRRSLFAVAIYALATTTLIGAGRQRAARAAAPPGPTFSNEVVRIFQANCQTCHHPGDIAPFSLMTYADAEPYASLIKFMTQTRQMPPWKPTDGCGDFADVRRLSQDQIDTIGQWVDQGAPEGNPAQLPEPLDFGSGWTLGPPDVIFSEPQPFTPPPGRDTYRCFTLPTNSTAAQYVSAIDVHPGDRETVHHVIAFIDTTGESLVLDEKEPGPGYTCFGGPGFVPTTSDVALGGWAPGFRPAHLPVHVAFRLPAHSRIVIQVHYHPHGAHPEPDRTEIGVYFAKNQPRQLMRILPLANLTFVIPPNDPNYMVTASTLVPFEAHLWMIAPHMHLLGKKMKVELIRPGETKCLINIDDWDFNWQGMYRYKEPIAIPAWSGVSLTAFYDNSSSNPRNPNHPPKEVRWGEETTDEMCIAFLGFTLDGEDLSQGLTVDTSWIPPLQ